MFTGIIQAIGTIAAIEVKNNDKRIYIRTNTLDLSNVDLGGSIAVNGVCLTATELPGDGFWADVSTETLAKTALVNINTGQSVNLEKALLANSSLGGHLVSGHVDGVAKVIERKTAGRSIQFIIEAPNELAKYIAAKGSVTIDGVSLTVNAVRDNQFDLNIVPHTLEHTIIGQYQVATKVNLEVDILARYIERLLMANHQDNLNSELSMDKLRQYGFIKK